MFLLNSFFYNIIKSSKEILTKLKQYHNNIYKDEIKFVYNLMNDDIIVIKMDTSNIINVNQDDYIKEDERMRNFIVSLLTFVHLKIIW